MISLIGLCHQEMNEKGEAYDLILKRVRDREIDKIMKRKREEHAKQFHTTTAGNSPHDSLILSLALYPSRSSFFYNNAPKELILLERSNLFCSPFQHSRTCTYTRCV